MWEAVTELLQDLLHQVADDEAQGGMPAMYFNDAGAVKHAALCEPDGRFTSKWGLGCCGGTPHLRRRRATAIQRVRRAGKWSTPRPPRWTRLGRLGSCGLLD